MKVPVGASAAVRVSGSSANLGAGFDCAALALGLDDLVDVTVTDGGLSVEVRGEGRGEVPLDDTHLVVRALRTGLAAAGVEVPGLAVTCTNAIPHARGLGSSAAAVVGGLAAANALATELGRGLSVAHLVQLSSEYEGHPDNASASVLGGATLSWVEHNGDHVRYLARSVPVHPSVHATAFVPPLRSHTSTMRGVLPDAVPRADAVFNVSRAALLGHALGAEPELLFAATADKLHQPYRAAAQADSAELVADLRARGIAALISGAGPAVLALTVGQLPSEVATLGAARDFAVLSLPIGEAAASRGAAVHPG